MTDDEEKLKKDLMEKQKEILEDIAKQSYPAQRDVAAAGENISKAFETTFAKLALAERDERIAALEKEAKELLERLAKPFIEIKVDPNLKPGEWRMEPGEIKIVDQQALPVHWKVLSGRQVYEALKASEHPQEETSWKMLVDPDAVVGRLFGDEACDAATYEKLEYDKAIVRAMRAEKRTKELEEELDSLAKAHDHMVVEHSKECRNVFNLELERNAAFEKIKELEAAVEKRDRIIELMGQDASRANARLSARITALESEREELVIAHGRSAEVRLNKILALKRFLKQACDEMGMEDTEWYDEAMKLVQE
jgi:hypothetical protein